MSGFWDWYNKNHSKVDWTPISKRDHRVFEERRAMFEQFMSDVPIHDMLDRFSGNYKYVKQEGDYATLVFKDDVYQSDIKRAERYRDDAMMFYDGDIRSVVAITYNTSNYEGWKG